MLTPFVLSVPHAGTNFTHRYLLSCQGPMIHTYMKGVEKMIAAAQPAVVVVPLRHPMSVWRSWISREGTLSTLPRELFLTSWRRLNEIYDSHQLYFLPLDAPERDDAYKRILRALGLGPDTIEELARAARWRDLMPFPAPKSDAAKVFEYSFIQEFYK